MADTTFANKKSRSRLLNINQTSAFLHLEGLSLRYPAVLSRASARREPSSTPPLGIIKHSEIESRNYATSKKRDKIKVLLVNPRFMATSQPPLGLAYLSSYLRTSGIAEVEIIDTTWQSLETEVEKRDSVDIIGLHIMSPYYKRAEKAANFLRYRFPEAKLIVGGPHVSAAPEHALKIGAEFGVIGEGEETFAELLSSIFTPGSSSEVPGSCRLDPSGSVVITETRPAIKDLDSLPFPDRKSLPMEAYLRRGIMQEFGFSALRATTMLTSRGCPYQCLFCNRALGRRVRYRTPENVLEEINDLISTYGIDGLFIVDDTFTLNKKHAVSVCELIRKKGIKLSIALNSRVDAVTPELLRTLRSAGVVSIAYGVESGNQEILDSLKKDITLDQIEAAVKYSKESGIHVKGYFMIGVPGENMTTMRQTVALAKRLPFDQVQFSVATPYPGTGLWEISRQRRLIESMDKMYDKGFFEGGAMRTEHLTAEEILNFHKRVCRPLVYRKIIGGVLRDWRSLPHFVTYMANRISRRSTGFREKRLAVNRPGSELSS